LTSRLPSGVQESGEQRAESREPRAEIREQRAENREQKESKEQGAESKEQGAESRQSAERREQRGPAGRSGKGSAPKIEVDRRLESLHFKG